jgi:hypothetical protein
MPYGSPLPLIYSLGSLGLLWLTARIAARTRFEALSLAQLRLYFFTSIAICLAVLCIKLGFRGSIVGFLAPLWLIALAVIAARCALEHHGLRTGIRAGWLAFLRQPREWLPRGEEASL